MKIPMFNMTPMQIFKSKSMLAGLGLVFLGGYMIKTGSAEFGFGIIMNGLGIMGIRDAR
jgi:hypothetical protein